MLAIGLVYWFWSGTGSSSEALIVTVERADVEDSVTALGNLQPRDYVDVGAQVSGQLDTLHVDVGATVKKGDLLAEIDPQLQARRCQPIRRNSKICARSKRIVRRSWTSHADSIRARRC